MTKDKSHNLEAKRTRPKGGWITNPVKTTRHGKNGSISADRRMKRLQKEIKELTG
jgi:hypothetical protein